MILYEIQILVSINKVLLDHSHVHSSTYCPLVLLRYDSGVEHLSQELYRSHRLTYLLSGPFTENVCCYTLIAIVHVRYNRYGCEVVGKGASCDEL